MAIRAMLASRGFRSMNSSEPHHLYDGPSRSIENNIAMTSGTDNARRLSDVSIGNRRISLSGDGERESTGRRLSQTIIDFFSGRRASRAASCDELNDVPEEIKVSFLSSVKNFIQGRRGSSVALNQNRRRSSAISSINQIATEVSDTLLPLVLNGKIPEQIARIAEKELGETTHIRRTALQELKIMIQETGMDGSWNMEDDTLLMFLRARKFNVVKAYQLMDHFYIYKITAFETYPVILDRVKDELEIGYSNILPFRDRNGCIVAINKVGLYDPDRFPAHEAINLAISFLAKLLEEPANQICGFVCIFDCANIPYRYLKHVRLEYARFISYYQDALPARYKGIHFLNENFIAKAAFRVAEVFLSKKVKSRIHFHGSNYSSLHQHIPPSILPLEYGGTLHSWRTKLNYEEFIRPKLLR